MLALSSVLSFLTDAAAAIVGNSTPGTIAAGVVGRGGYIGDGRYAVGFHCSIAEHGGARAGRVVWARDHRAAMRGALKLARTSTYGACGFDGPIVRFGPPEVCAGIVSAACYGPDGVECGSLTITRADGEPIRSRRCVAAVAGREARR